jgi:hypothetical protein
MDRTQPPDTVRQTCCGATCERCPATGLTVVRLPEWARLTLDTGLVAAVEILGGAVLVVRLQGRASGRGARRAFEYADEIVARHLDAGPYAFVLDISRLGGASLEARRLFLKRLGPRSRLKGVVIHGGSPAFKMSIGLAARTKLLGANLMTAGSHEGAVARALKLVKRHGGVSAPEAAAENRVAPDHWHIRFEEVSIRFEVLDGRIVHSVTRGSIRQRHLAPLAALRKEVFAAVAASGMRPYIVSGMDELHGVSRKARRRYLASIIDGHRR